MVKNPAVVGSAPCQPVRFDRRLRVFRRPHGYACRNRTLCSTAGDGDDSIRPLDLSGTSRG